MSNNDFLYAFYTCSPAQCARPLAVMLTDRRLLQPFMDEVFRIDLIHADAGSLLLKSIFFHMRFSPVSVLSGQRDGAW